MAQITLSEFADKINKIVPVMMKEFAKRQFSDAYAKITLPQFFILGILHKEGELKMSDLAKTMNVSTAAMTGIVSRLVRDGYVERVYDVGDRRIIKVRATKKGSNVVDKVNLQRREMILDLFSHIPEQERGVYLRVLMKIQEMLTAREQGIKK